MLIKDLLKKCERFFLMNEIAQIQNKRNLSL